MEFLKSAWDWIVGHWAILAPIALFVWSELLGSIEVFKASSLFELVLNFLKKNQPINPQ